MSRGGKTYRDWHWGIDPKHTIEWDDPDYPPGELVECGRLVELHVREPGERRDTILRLNKKESAGSHLVFDPNHPNQRLYILSHPDFAARIKASYRSNPDYKGGSKYKAMPLAEVAKAVGGRHGGRDYADVSVSPVGILTHVVYATEKQGDGYSNYIHKLGEESGIRPALSADAKGRLWVVGGNYTSPNPGITD
jgi:hypothetical protein